MWNQIPAGAKLVTAIIFAVLVYAAACPGDGTYVDAELDRFDTPPSIVR